MTNRQKYNDELMAIWESGWQFCIEKETNSLKKCSTSTINCKDCIFYAVHDCIPQRVEWLKQEYVEPIIKTVKASELPIDTVVWCGKNKYGERIRRKFATVFDGKLFAQSNYSEHNLIYWECMWLGDGTEVLAE